MKAFIIVFVYFLWLAVGCTQGGKQPQPTKPKAGSVERYPAKVYDLPRSYVVEFRLEDGTRCVGNDDGGITCDWHRTETEQ